jgi:hypothetical protein
MSLLVVMGLPLQRGLSLTGRVDIGYLNHSKTTKKFGPNTKLPRTVEQRKGRPDSVR